MTISIKDPVSWTMQVCLPCWGVSVQDTDLTTSVLTKPMVILGIFIQVKERVVRWNVLRGMEVCCYNLLFIAKLSTLNTGCCLALARGQHWQAPCMPSHVRVKAPSGYRKCWSVTFCKDIYNCLYSTCWLDCMNTHVHEYLNHWKYVCLLICHCSVKDISWFTVLYIHQYFIYFNYIHLYWTKCHIYMWVSHTGFLQ